MCNNYFTSSLTPPPPPCLFPSHHLSVSSAGPNVELPRACRSRYDILCIKHRLCCKNNSCRHNWAQRGKSKCLLWLCSWQWSLTVIIKLMQFGLTCWQTLGKKIKSECLWRRKMHNHGPVADKKDTLGIFQLEICSWLFLMIVFEATDPEKRLISCLSKLLVWWLSLYLRVSLNV